MYGARAYFYASRSVRVFAHITPRSMSTHVRQASDGILALLWHWPVGLTDIFDRYIMQAILFLVFCGRWTKSVG